MSMIVGLFALRDDTLAQLHADPPLVWRILFPDDYEEMESRSRGGASQPPTPPPRSELQLTADEGQSINLDKAWHGLHFLYTGTDWEGEGPLAFLMQGRVLGDLDLGYGPGRTFTAEETREIAKAVAACDDEVLRQRFDPERMIELAIYPEIWDRDPAEDDTLGYLLECAAELRRFLTATATVNHGFLIVCT